MELKENKEANIDNYIIKPIPLSHGRLKPTYGYIIEKDNDDIEVKVKKLKVGKKYTYSISGVAKKGSKSYKTKFRINAKSGKVTVKKGLKKGTYKVRVRITASGNDSRKPASKTVTFKVRVK